MTQSNEFVSIQKIGSQFQKAWEACINAPGQNERPSLKQSLAQVDEPRHGACFKVLVGIELKCRDRLGEQVMAGDYDQFGKSAMRYVSKLLEPPRLKGVASSDVADVSPTITRQMDLPVSRATLPPKRSSEIVGNPSANNSGNSRFPVSYTHLTLPTKRIV